MIIMCIYNAPKQSSRCVQWTKQVIQKHNDNVNNDCDNNSTTTIRAVMIITLCQHTQWHHTKQYSVSQYWTMFLNMRPPTWDVLLLETESSTWTSPVYTYSSTTTSYRRIFLFSYNIYNTPIYSHNALILCECCLLCVFFVSNPPPPSFSLSLSLSYSFFIN